MTAFEVSTFTSASRGNLTEATLTAPQKMAAATYTKPTPTNPQTSDIPPSQANDNYTGLSKTWKSEWKTFNADAKSNSWLAIEFFMQDMSNTLLQVQGAMMNMESSLMDTVSLLNTDLTQVNSDMNNIFQDLQNGDTSGGQLTKDIQSFMDDSAQFYGDFYYYFGDSTLPGNGPWTGSQWIGGDFYGNGDTFNSIQNSFNTFGNFNGVQNSGTLFEGFFNLLFNPYGSTEWNEVGSSLQTLFTNSYNNTSGDGEKQTLDVVTNAETTLNQQSTAASTQLTADQQNYNSYESTMKDILTQVAQLYQGIVHQISASTSS